MLVNFKSAQRCCKYDYPDFGHSSKRKDKNELKRKIRRREKQSFKNELRAMNNY